MKDLTMQPISNSVWRNKKNQELYRVHEVGVVNATNAQEGQRMVLYGRAHWEDTPIRYIREEAEFVQKFEFIGPGRIS